MVSASDAARTSASVRSAHSRLRNGIGWRDEEVGELCGILELVVSRSVAVAFPDVPVECPGSIEYLGGSDPSVIQARRPHRKVA